MWKHKVQPLTSLCAKGMNGFSGNRSFGGRGWRLSRVHPPSRVRAMSKTAQGLDRLGGAQAPVRRAEPPPPGTAAQCPHHPPRPPDTSPLPPVWERRGGHHPRHLFPLDSASGLSQLFSPKSCGENEGKILLGGGGSDEHCQDYVPGSSKQSLQTQLTPLDTTKEGVTLNKLEGF